MEHYPYLHVVQSSSLKEHCEVSVNFLSPPSSYFECLHLYFDYKCLAQWLDDREVERSNPTSVALAISYFPLCQCLSEETLKAVGPFYLVSKLGEVKYSTQWVNV